MKNEIFAPDFPDADFVMACVGDSMINARIFDGDLVYIRQQETVENGEIAAVLIDGAAILRRVWKHPDCLVLEPANPMYMSRVFYGDEMECVQILGKVLACTFVLSDCNAEGRE